MRVGRGVIGAVLVGVLAVTATGCAKPPGTDGDLINQWPAMAAPVGWQPKAEVCLGATSETLTRDAYSPVDCKELHRYETVYVGEFTGSVGNADTPPAKASDGLKAAWSECDNKASEFLGGPWRERKIWIGMSVPTPTAWKSGAKWFLCQVAKINQLGGPQSTGNTSLKGQFDQADLQYGCFQVAEDGKYTAKTCTEAHNAEFAGVFVWDATFKAMNEELDKADDKLHDECQKVITKFAGASVRTGTWIWQPDEDDWNAGDHSLRCYYYFSGITVSKSLKGVGAAGWPLK